MSFFEKLCTTPNEIKNLPKPVKQITLVVFIYYLSWGLVIPFLPLFFFDVLGSYGAATFISALVTFFSLFWILPIGKFLDRYSQRKLLRFTILLYLPIWPVLAIIRAMWHAVLYQLYHSVVSAMLWSSADTFNRNHACPGKRSEAWGFYDIGKAMSLIIGAVTGGLLLEYVMDIRLLFILFPPFLVVGAFLTSKYLPEDPLKKELKALEAFNSISWRSLYFKGISDFYNTRGLLKIWPFIFLLGFLVYSQMVMIPLFADSVGATYMAIGIMFALFNLPMLMEAPFSVLADTWSSRRLIATGSVLASVSLFGFGLSNDIAVLFPLSLLLGLAIAMLVPTISGAVGDKMKTEKIGELNSVFIFSQGLGGITGLFILGPIADVIGVQNVFFISSSVMLFSAVLAWIVWERKLTLAKQHSITKKHPFSFGKVRK